jgi:hypothetical protein
VELPKKERIAGLLEATLTSLADGEPAPVQPPSEVQGHLDALVAKGQYTVRDGILTLLATELAHGELIDWRVQPLHNPARAASKFLGSTLYPRLHIVGSPEALQTGVKGTQTYMGRSNETWNSVLKWASQQADLEVIESAFLYLATQIVNTARSVPALPGLDTPRLTFPRVFGVIDDLLEQPSGGAYEQLIFASLLDALRQQLELDGVIETKHINAADAAAGVAADVQERHRGQVKEAYEVTAETFEAKVPQAIRTLDQHDLLRVHILAKGAVSASADEIAGVIPSDADISVLDVREEIRSLIARLDKPHRREALGRLYRLLIDKQPNDELVSCYVDGLEEMGLTLER